MRAGPIPVAIAYYHRLAWHFNRVEYSASQDRWKKNEELFVFGRKKNWEDTYDEAYSDRPERVRAEQPKLWIHLTFLAVLAVIFVGAVWAVAGWRMAERTLQALTAPLGLVWLILLMQLYFLAIYRHGKTFLVTVGLFALVTLSGNEFVKRFLVSSLESEYLAQPPLEEPVEVLVVLGGATGTKPNGETQVTRAGERIVTTVRLHRDGKCKQIIVTGTKVELLDENDHHPCEEAQTLLLDLGIPAETITMLRGINTREEAESFAVWHDRQSFSTDTRIGLVTSAWHLRRAISQFERHGIKVIPIAADSLTTRPRPTPTILLPSAENLEIVTLMLREHLGRLVGR